MASDQFTAIPLKSRFKRKAVPFEFELIKWRIQIIFARNSNEPIVSPTFGTPIIHPVLRAELLPLYH